MTTSPATTGQHVLGLTDDDIAYCETCLECWGGESRGREDQPCPGPAARNDNLVTWTWPQAPVYTPVLTLRTLLEVLLPGRAPWLPGQLLDVPVVVVDHATKTERYAANLNLATPPPNLGPPRIELHLPPLTD